MKAGITPRNPAPQASATSQTASSRCSPSNACAFPHPPPQLHLPGKPASCTSTSISTSPMASRTRSTAPTRPRARRRYSRSRSITPPRGSSPLPRLLRSPIRRTPTWTRLRSRFPSPEVRRTQPCCACGRASSALRTRSRPILSYYSAEQTAWWAIRMRSGTGRWAAKVGLGGVRRGSVGGVQKCYYSAEVTVPISGKLHEELKSTYRRLQFNQRRESLDLSHVNCRTHAHPFL